MKTVKLLTITSLVVLLLAGCDKGNENVLEDTSTDGVYTLNAGERSQVLKGDIIEPNSADTRIEIEHIIDDDNKFVTVLEGSATLLRGSYAVE